MSVLCLCAYTARATLQREYESTLAFPSACCEREGHRGAILDGAQRVLKTSDGQINPAWTRAIECRRALGRERGSSGAALRDGVGRIAPAADLRCGSVP